jgi:hypothetical protein
MSKIIPAVGLVFILIFSGSGQAASIVLNFKRMTLLSDGQREKYLNDITSAALNSGAVLEPAFVTKVPKSVQRLCFEGIFGPEVTISNVDSPGIPFCIKNKKNSENFFMDPKNSTLWSRFIIKLSLACTSTDCAPIRAATEKIKDPQWTVK